MRGMRLGSTVASAAVAGALLFAAAPATASEDTDPRWLPWLGCWEPVGAAVDHLLCVRPLVDDSGVEMLTIADGEIVSTEIIRADGTERPVRREGCNGWDKAEFSATGWRLYLRSEFACEGAVRRSSTGLISMTAPDAWLDVQVVGAAGQNAVRVVRYRLASAERQQAAGIGPIAEERALAVNTARAAAAVAPTIDDIVEASSRVAPEAVEAWIVERAERFALNADRIEHMADAGVPASVIDLVVAISYPKTFAVDRAGRAGDFRPAEEAPRRAADHYVYPGYVDPFFWDPFRYSRYGGFYSPWGYGGGYGWYPGYQPVIVIVSPDDVEPAAPGRVVRNRGYTRGGRTVSEPGASGFYRPPSSSSDPGMRSGGSSTGSAVTTGGHTSGGSGSTERKAKPRGGKGTGGSS